MQKSHNSEKNDENHVQDLKKPHGTRHTKEKHSSDLELFFWNLI